MDVISNDGDGDGERASELAHAVALLTYEIFLTYSRYYTSLPARRASICTNFVY